MSLYLSIIIASCSLGIKVRNVELKYWRICPNTLDSSTTSHTSLPIIWQQAWKETIVNPSGLGDFSDAMYLIVCSTYSSDVGWVILTFCSGDTKVGINLWFSEMFLSVPLGVPLTASWSDLSIPFLYPHGSQVYLLLVFLVPIFDSGFFYWEEIVEEPSVLVSFLEPLDPWFLFP
jgi:hypothetical protein